MARILLAEDEAPTREFLAKALLRSGHGVTVVGDGIEAMSTLTEATMDLLLADVVLPGMDGIELARRAAKEQPDIKVMFITGFAAVSLRARSEGTRGRRVLSKPFHVRELPDQVGKILADTQYAAPPPERLVESIREVSAELVSYLKSHPDELRSIRPRQFEELIAEILSRYGWKVHITPATRDGGYDLFAVTTDAAGTQSSWIIECKKWEAKVGVDVVRNIHGIRNTMKVGGAMVVTTSHFTRDAYTYRATKTSVYDLALKDYDDILEWIKDYRPNPNGTLYIKDSSLVLPDQNWDP